MAYPTKVGTYTLITNSRLPCLVIASLQQTTSVIANSHSERGNPSLPIAFLGCYIVDCYIVDHHGGCCHLVMTEIESCNFVMTNTIRVTLC